MKHALLFCFTLASLGNLADAQVNDKDYDIVKQQRLIGYTHQIACSTRSEATDARKDIGLLVDDLTKIINARIEKINASGDLSKQEKLNLNDPYNAQLNTLGSMKQCPSLPNPSSTPSGNTSIPNNSLTVPKSPVIVDSIQVGTNKEQDVQITNTDKSSNISVTEVKVVPGSSGPQPAYFEIVRNDCPAALQPSKACAIRFRFTPLDTNTRIAEIHVTSTILDANGKPTGATFQNIFEVQGKGTAPDDSVSLPKSPVIVDDTEVGTNKEQDVQITNIHGTDSIRILNVKVLSDDSGKDSVFRIVSDNCPASLAHSENCKTTFRFTPVDGMAMRVAKIQVTSKKLDASGNPTGDEFQNTFEVQGKGMVADLAPLYHAGKLEGTPTKRIVAGIDISGASSASGQQKFFIEAGLDVPVCCSSTTTDPLDHRLWLFLTPRISSIAQSPTPVSNLNTSGDFLGSSLPSNTAQLVESIDVAGGAEFMFLKPRHGIPFWGEYANTHARIGAGLIFAAGVSTPFTSPEGIKQAQEFVVNQGIKDAYPKLFTDPAKTVAAFVNRDRSRFFRKYYGGIRLKTYFFTDKASLTKKENPDCPDSSKKSDCDPVYDIFPGTVDLAIGQDEAITGGRLRGLTFRLEAVYPLPFVKGLHIYGGLYTALARNKSTDPLILLPPSPLLDLNDAKVQIIPVDPLNRDTYRIGIGYDLLQLPLFKKKSQAAPTAPALTTTNASVK